MYYKEFDGALPEDLTSLATSDNQLGLVQSGCTLEYKYDTYDVVDDNGELCETFVVSDEATLKSGILTWDGNSLAVLCNTARVTDNPETGMRTVRIGGIGNDNG